MATSNPVRQRLVSTIAAVERHHGPGDPRLGPLRAELAAERLTECIRRLVGAAPPMTEQQLARSYAALDDAPRARALT